jgi:hypothetical protein
MCLSPASVFLTFAYTESLFQLLTFAGVWMLLNHKPMLAAMAFCASCAVRSNGATPVQQEHCASAVIQVQKRASLQSNSLRLTCLQSCILARCANESNLLTCATRLIWRKKCTLCDVCENSGRSFVANKVPIRRALSACSVCRDGERRVSTILCCSECVKRNAAKAATLSCLMQSCNMLSWRRHDGWRREGGAPNRCAMSTRVELFVLAVTICCHTVYTFWTWLSAHHVRYMTS